MSANICKLISLNLRGINNFQKRRIIFSWCCRKNADFAFLQETHSKKEIETQWRNEWGGKSLCSHGSSNSGGVAALIKNGVDCIIHSTIVDPSGRYLILKVEIEDNSYILTNFMRLMEIKISLYFFETY